jgi:phosphatidylserine/phosphatidylglycerophosphate/cardiolipin synthase-like enzyme
MKVFFRCLVMISVVCSLTLDAADVAPAQTKIVYFSPQDHLADQLIARIAKENASIKAAVYALTHKGVAQALARAKKRGVQVEVIVDPFSLKRKTAVNLLAKADVPVWIWSPDQYKDEKQPLMHDKFCVFGDSSVWTGSFNFTYDADIKNEENAVVLEDPAIARQFAEQFARIKGKGVVLYELYRT